MKLNKYMLTVILTLLCNMLVLLPSATFCSNGIGIAPLSHADSKHKHSSANGVN